MIIAGWSHSEWNCSKHEAAEYKHGIYEAVTRMRYIKSWNRNFLYVIFLGTHIPCWLQAYRRSYN